MIQSRLKQVDIFSPTREASGYVGTKMKPTLLGFVYADIQPVTDEISEEMAGITNKKKIKLILRPDAGVQCGDLAAVYGKSPDFTVTEIKHYSTHMAVTAVSL